MNESVKQAYRKLRAGYLSVGLPRDREFAQPPEEVAASGEMSVIVAINDAPEMLRRCLHSLEVYGPKAEVVLVDDGSELEQTQKVIDEFCRRNDWKLVRHEKSKGHSRSCESGAAVATRPYLCLLNSDTLITPWSWAEARRAFESDPQIGITGPSTSWSATEQKIERAEYCRHFWSDRQIYAFAKQQTGGVPTDSRVEIRIVGGFALFIRRDLWIKLGGFDTNLPDYGNESELCLRVHKAGFRCVWTPRNYIHHFGHQSYSKVGKAEIDRRAREAKTYIDTLYSR